MRFPALREVWHTTGMLPDEKLQFKIIWFMALGAGASLYLVAALAYGCVGLLSIDVCFAIPRGMDTFVGSAVYVGVVAVVAVIAWKALRRLFQLLDV